ncbi:macro domain-containing protein [Halomicrobium urmianum]|uniref:macro domain-containing protein n=1 Tax=Halomicrobium urmianum TaxID=1586233 RepID=UPI001CD9ADE0|nr:macro domain-containing protein [Halomicrobium urmianum]
MEFSVVLGDLAEQSADALIYDAKTDLEMERDIARTLSREAGEAIVEDVASEGPVELGQVVVTDAYELDADYVIHAAAIPSHGQGEPSTASIRAATKNALRRADTLDCDSCAMSVLGVDTATQDFRDGAQDICETIREYDPSRLERCDVVVSSESQYEYVARTSESIRSA